MVPMMGEILRALGNVEKDPNVEIYFLVDSTGTIVNHTLWNPKAEPNWKPAPGFIVVRCPTQTGYWRDGWKWDGEKAYDPNPPPLVVEPEIPANAPSNEGMTVI